MSFSKIWTRYFTVFRLNVEGHEDFISLKENFEGEKKRRAEEHGKFDIKFTLTILVCHLIDTRE